MFVSSLFLSVAAVTFVRYSLSLVTISDCGGPPASTRKPWALAYPPFRGSPPRASGAPVQDNDVLVSVHDDAWTSRTHPLTNLILSGTERQTPPYAVDFFRTQ